MSCVRSIFKCNFTDNEIENNQSFYNKQITNLKGKISDVEMELKSIKISYDLEFKRIEDKLLQNINTLDTKLDTIMLLINKK